MCSWPATLHHRLTHCKHRMSSERYIGLMTGTSLDNIDAALITFDPTPHVLATHSEPLPDALRTELLALTRESRDELNRMMHCDRELGLLYSQAVQHLLASANTNAQTIRAIGSHGQTLRHSPDTTPAWTLQIGDPATLAVTTGIRVIADFRRQDIAAGGHGAPLAPGFHASVFQSGQEDRVILNLGGIANITVLPKSGTATGFDTGPANSLLDLWTQQHQHKPFDTDGQWARSGEVDQALLTQWMDSTPWFRDPPPKSTGREVFGLDWLTSHIAATHKPDDAQATLLELSARTIADAIKQHAPANSAVYACGGGTRNGYLMDRIQALLPGHALQTTAALGVDPEWVEAIAFAWLAKQRLHGLPGNLPSVTGASRALVLGAIYES